MLAVRPMSGQQAQSASFNRVLQMLEEAEVTCPYCWEIIVLELDLSAGSQTYTEDCSVCCQPILVRLRVDLDDEHRFEVEVQPEND